MKALVFDVNVPRFLAAKGVSAILGDRVFFKGPLRTVRLADVPEPALPGPDWVKLKTFACGFCGSDLNLLRLHDSPTASPFTSFPCVLGHEIVGEILEVGAEAEGFSPGERVVVCPPLGCETRGIAPPCPSCRAGRPANCENFAEGSLPPGMFIGITRGLNGGFAPFLAAHRSQLFRVPDALPMEAAVMIEPLAVALQALFDNPPQDGDRILVIGAGVIGNLIIQAIRLFAPGCPISVLEPAEHAAQLALRYGASEVIPRGRTLQRASAITGGSVYKPMLGMNILMGGFHKVYDTVASSSTLKLAMRVLAAMGTLSIVGIGAKLKLDPTPLWLKLQTLKGVYAYGFVTYHGQQRHVFDIALDLMAQGRIAADTLVTHRFPLHEFQKIIEVNLNKKKHQAMKTIVTFG